MRSHLDQSALQTLHGAAVGEVIEAIATAAIELAALIADGPLAGITGRNGGINSDGDQQKDIDVAADEMMRRALQRRARRGRSFRGSRAPGNPRMPRRRFASRSIRSTDRPISKTISRSAPSFRSAPGATTFCRPSSSPARRSAAAGFIVYGPQTTLVLALNARVDIFILDRRAGEFLLTARGVQVAPDTPEFAINASNRRHWHGPVRAYIDECLAGTNGASEADFNMRWIGSLVAESLRILVRGGVFLYPADARPGYREGRLRLLYEAHPMALVMEWAGGAASTGRRRILELGAKTPHQRVPLIMGSVRGVRDVAAIHEGIEPMFDNSDAPLFARRGLFR